MNHSSRTISSQIQQFPFYEDARLEYMETIFTTSVYDPNLISDSGLASYSVVFWVTGIITFLTCIPGIAGNGMVIWLLGFRLKRNPFTAFILNLAVADLGILIFIMVGYVTAALFWEDLSLRGFTMYATIYSLIYITDQLLLTTISIDRCVAALFPLWYRCHRPPNLSRIVCILLWVLSFLINGLDFLLTYANEFALLQFIVNVAICTPLMSISTIILFVKICTKAQQQKRGKVLTVISLALFFFLLFGSPMNYWYVVSHFYILDAINVTSLLSSDLSVSELISTELLSVANLLLIPPMVAFVCTAFNCSINPLIYFLVGRKKKDKSWPSMKSALQQVFKEEEDCRGQDETTAETEF